MSADEHLNQTQFSKHPYKQGRYRADITFKSGRKGPADVYKTQEGNPSARGGAYRDVWIATHAMEKGRAETRQGAYNALVNRFRDRGIVE